MLLTTCCTPSSENEREPSIFYYRPWIPTYPYPHVDRWISGEKRRSLGGAREPETPGLATRLCFSLFIGLMGEVCFEKHIVPFHY